MKKSLHVAALLLFTAAFILSGCDDIQAPAAPANGTNVIDDTVTDDEIKDSPQIVSLSEKLAMYSSSADPTTMTEITEKLGLISPDDAETLEAASDRLDELAASGDSDIMESFSLFLTELLTSGTGLSDEAKSLLASQIQAAWTRVIVSDGITKKGAAAADEIIPSAIVYALPEPADAGMFNYLLAYKVKNARVQFYCATKTLGALGIWSRLGDPVYTDENGKARLDALAPHIPSLFFPSLLSRSQVDLYLKAEVIIDDTTLIDTTVSDDQGIIRILSSYDEKNHDVILTDHDNTLHETGGANTLADILDSVNVLKKEWPLVDDVAAGEVKKWISDGKDMIIISGMSPHMRDKCREQMELHFGDGGDREILIIVEEDTAYDESNEFKAGTIASLKKHYGLGSAGTTHVSAMVGDTVRQDGYGAFANDILYVPFQVHYKTMPSLLDTEGYGFIDPDTIAWDWAEVMEMIRTGKITPKNVWLRNAPFRNIAHRGGGELAPEDTLVAYRNALDLGADAIEGDCHMTSDGVMVVSHDSTVDRCTDGTGEIGALTLARIKNLDAGYRFTADGGTYPYRGKGVTIPTVREVFELLTDEYPEAPMILEIKSEENRDLAVDKVLDLIAEYDGGTGSLMNRLQLGAFNQEALDLVKDKCAERGMNCVRCYATEGVMEFLFTPLSALTAEDYEAPGEVLALPWALATHPVMSKARKAGVKANIWTVNDEFQMKWYKNVIRVDGIMTDNPALLREVILSE
ncbi:MAG TPA: glycerophosphodiester phosphodiesterase family protein [Spirochaetota bacterium]|nr:glycerophosphodiester phosphodiesterase family protein [Spirochaetota bacterium]